MTNGVHLYVVAQISSVLSTTTFCSFVREFSPLGVYVAQVSEDSCAVGDDSRVHRFSSGRGRTLAATNARGQTRYSVPL